MAALLLLLFSVGALFSSCNARESNYDKLSESFKKGVDLALEKLHSHEAIQHHFVFLRSLSLSDIQVAYGFVLFSSAVAHHGLVFLSHERNAVTL